MAKIWIYHCYGGAHSSVTAAAIHVGLLRGEEPPSAQVLLSMPYFDTQKAADHGVLQFVGKDEQGALVFSVGLETAPQQVLRGMKNVLAIAGAGLDQVRFVDTMGAVNGWMKIGGLCSRALGLKGLGRPLVVYGTRRAYKNLRALVEGVKKGV